MKRAHFPSILFDRVCVKALVVYTPTCIFRYFPLHTLLIFETRNRPLRLIIIIIICKVDRESMILICITNLMAKILYNLTSTRLAHSLIYYINNSCDFITCDLYCCGALYQSV